MLRAGSRLHRYPPVPPSVCLHTWPGQGEEKRRGKHRDTFILSRCCPDTLESREQGRGILSSSSLLSCFSGEIRTAPAEQMKSKRLNNILMHALSTEGWVVPLLAVPLMVINGGDVICLYSCKAGPLEREGRMREIILSGT